MRSFDDVANIQDKREERIPDRAGAPAGLTGVKAPYGYKQECDIKDRLAAAGVLRPIAFEIKK